MGEKRTATDRLEKDIFASSAFEKLKQIHGERFDGWVHEKVYACRRRLGLRAARALRYRPMKRCSERHKFSLTAVVWSNLTLPLMSPCKAMCLGRSTRLNWQKSCNDAIFLHVSTAFVRGVQPGSVPRRVTPTVRNLC